MPAGILVCGDLRLDLATKAVWVDGVLQHLGPAPYALLLALARRQGRTVTMAEFGQDLWPGQGLDKVGKSIAQRVSRLRKQLEPDGNAPYYVLTVPGVGYRLNATPRHESMAPHY